MNDLVDPQPQFGLRRRRRAMLDADDDLDHRDLQAVENTANVNHHGLVGNPRNIWPPPDDFELDLAEARRGRIIIPPRAPVRPIRPIRPPQRRQRRPPSDTPNNFNITNGRISQLYCLVSTLLAILAVIVAPSKTYPVELEIPPSISSFGPSSISPWSNVEHVAKAAAVGLAARKGEKPDLDSNDLLQSIQQWWNTQQQLQQQQQQQKQPTKVGPQATNSPASTMTMPSPFWWWRHNRQKDVPTKPSSQVPTTRATDGLRATLSEVFWNWIDPAVLWNPTARTPTDIIEKILTSTPRLLAIANFMLAMTYLVHSAIAAWFLGDHSAVSSAIPGSPPNLGAPSSADWSSPTRERMGGFLVFKLLLISAVVAPDTLDLLILLTWYTTLSCLRSLDHLAHATTTHLSALGQPPKAGVLKLLILVLVGDILAAASCVALFHSAGLGMVLLLTCDCALLASDVLSHIIKHFTCALEDLHSQTISSLEARQIQLHNQMNNNSNHDGSSTSVRSLVSSTEQQDDPDEQNRNEDHAVIPLGDVDTVDDGVETYQRRRSSSPDDIQQESRRLDQRMEVLELAHSRRLSIMDNAMFALDLICHALTVAHFCHIWSLHGVQFTLIDGVLALHLHAAISSACKKIAQRRNVHSIARDLHGLFPNASDQELRKASLAGDVCCICLGTMSTGGHVKKVPCGHLYHTHCLREVVERAQSVQAAKCPLCRSCLIDGQRQSQNNNEGAAVAGTGPTVVLANQAAPAPPPATGAEANPPPPQQQGGADHALFRFSTEGIIPAWIPVPAFSFEVVRRPSAAAPLVPAPAPVPIIGQQAPAQQPAAGVQLEENVENRGQPPTAAAWGGHNLAPLRPQNVPILQPDQQDDAPSFLRRFLILAGAVPMSPQEEARALAHLVDMFPQYERSHLLRELRERGSPEAVAEAILMGVFSSGVPRGE